MESNEMGLVFGQPGGCVADTEKTQNTDDYEGEHPTITITTRANTDYHTFLAALREKYPELNIEVISYVGYNTSEYANTQLKAHDIADIFVATYPPADELQTENLLDLSGYEFVSNINSKTLNDISVDGAIYLVPAGMSIGGTWYNKTLFDENGWEVPKSLPELEALIPEIEAAGVKLVECATQYTGATFSYFFDFNAPEYFTSLDGIAWQNEFLKGDSMAAGTLEDCADRFQYFINLGMLPIGETPTDDNATRSRFKEGNTAFFTTISTNIGGFTQNEDGTGDEYRIMPYLSEDGSNNVVITSTSMYFGLSSRVAEDETKLEDALKVMSFISSTEGQEALKTSADQISLVIGASMEEDNPLYEVARLVDEGKYMNIIYSGWESIIVDIGEQVLAMMNGEITGEQLLENIDEIQQANLASGVETYAEVTETLNMAQVAQLVGAAYAEGTGADCALISLGGYHPNTELDEDGNVKAAYENSMGVNAKLYAGIPLDSQVMTTFNPINPSNPIKLMTLTGAQIKQFAKEGFYRNTNDTTAFEYVLVTKEGMELDDAATYTVACVGESEERGKTGNITDSAVTSGEALIAYLHKIGTVNAETIVWK